MKKYDDASWHYEGNYPHDIPPENAANHIGMFLKWCIMNGCISDELKEDCGEDLEKVRAGYMTGAQFLIIDLDEKLLSEDLSNLGQQFANDYYENETRFADEYSSYVADFGDIFDKKSEEKGFEYPTLYHVEDTLENYLIIANKIGDRFKEWTLFNKQE